jgi:hypothetical protein
MVVSADMAPRSSLRTTNLADMVESKDVTLRQQIHFEWFWLVSTFHFLPKRTQPRRSDEKMTEKKS